MKMIVSPAPHLHSETSTKSLMNDVLIALSPTVLVAILFYGWRGLMILAVSVASCVILEYLISKFLLGRKDALTEPSAVVTGVLLALNLPPMTPWWIVVIGAVVAIGIVKMTFGGLGQNVFNPAIAARVFLLVSFPAVMTDWTVPTGFIHETDAISGATLLGLAKAGDMADIASMSAFETMFMNIGGSAGEISSVAILTGFIYMLVRRVIRPHITLSIWATVAVFSGLFCLIDPGQYTGPVFNLFTGGLMLGSVFMATDYVTSPMSARGGIIYGVGIGLITMLIRYFGAYPEGVSFAILLMNAVVPIIDRFCHEKKYGRV